MNERAAVVIPAAGSGRRMGGMRKAYAEVAGQPLLLHALRPFLDHPALEQAIIALAPEEMADPPGWLIEVDERVRIVAGGAERSDSVRQAMESVRAAVDVVLIHDAARPLVTRAVVDRVFEAARAGTGAIASVAVTDTIKEVDDDGRVTATPDRSRLRQAQTPQGFPRSVILELHRRAAAEGVRTTDDAALVERYGGTVVAVEGSPENLKVTTPADLAVAAALLEWRERGGA